MVIKTRRWISWEIYLFALTAAAVVFGIGIYVGTQLQRGAVSELSDKIDELGQKIASIETLLLFEEGFCEVFVDKVDEFHSETYEIGKKIEHMEKIEVDPKLKAEYMFLELRDYMLVKKLSEMCAQNYTTILYFLNSASCGECWAQGEELTKFRNLAKKEKIKLFVYNFDMSINSSTVSALSKKFDIKVYPTLIINGKKHEGFIRANDIVAFLG